MTRGSRASIAPVKHQRTVHRATKREHPVLADLLARSFFDDPVMTWLIPEPRHRYGRLKSFYRAELDVYQRRNRIYTSSDHSAAALWAAPGNWKIKPSDIARGTPRQLSSFRHRAITGLGLLSTMEKQHPTEPHWYLGIIGADPARQGTGAGRAVMEVVLEECDEQGLGAYLESSKVANVPYYERYGFAVTGEISVDRSPTLYPMWRDPR